MENASRRVAFTRQFGRRGTRAAWWALLGLAIASVTTPAQVDAQLPAAQLHALQPAGGRQGTIVRVRLASGADNEGAHQLLFSHPHITAVQSTRAPTFYEQGPQPVPGEFTVAIHPDVTPGIYEARFAGRFGVSNPRAFVVGVLPEQQEPTDNRTPAKAATVPVNSIVNGTADATANDFFKITLKKDERVVVDCWAERIDSRMDGSLVLYDASGRELAIDRDTNRHDPLLTFTAPADGEYTIKLHDALYRGGNDYFYRLLISTGPYVDFVFPPVAQAGTKSAFTVFGSHLPGGADAGLTSRGRALEKLTVEIAAPAANDSPINNLVRAQDATLDGFEYRVAAPTGDSNPALIGYVTAPVVEEKEPNDDPNNPQQLTLPCTLVGRFAPRGDYDWVSFEAKKGDTYWIDALSQRLGLPTDPYLLIQRVTRNDKGEVQATDVQELDDGPKGAGIPTFRPGGDDPAYRFVAPEDGTYRILVRDLYGGSRGDPRLVYALSLRRAAPDFSLVAVPTHHGNFTAAADSAPAGPLLRRGGTEMIHAVALRRDGFNAPIQVSLEGLPAGVIADPVTIFAGEDNATIVLRATADAPAWHGAIRLVGKATVDGKELAHTARAAAVAWPTPVNQPPETRISRDLWLSVLDAETAPFLAELGAGKTWEMSRAGKLDIPVKLTRYGDMKQSVTLAPLGLPANVKAGAVTIAPEASEGTLSLEIAEKARPGTYHVRLQGTAPVPYRRDPEGAAAATATKEKIDKLAAELTASSQAAEAARAAAEKAAADTAAAAKQATELATAELQKATALAEAAKAATAKAAAAREAAEKDTTNQDLAQAREAADKAVTDVQAQLQTAAAAQAAAEKSAAEATARLQSAAADKAVKDKVAAEAAALAKIITDAKTAADKRAADLVKAAEQKNVTVFESSTTTTVTIVAAPATLSVTAPTAAFAQGAQAEVPVTIARLFGFAEPVDVEFVVPEALKGITAAKLTLPADQTAGKLTLVAAADAPAGKHSAVARAKFKFNGQDFTVDQTFGFEIAPK